MRSLLLSLFIMAFYNVSASPNWNYTVTYNAHVILIQSNSLITIDSTPIDTGDYIGVFYVNPYGQLKCGGYTVWNGQMTYINAWPEDAGNDGFPAGSEFIWMIWDNSESKEYMARAIYSGNPVFSNTGNFSVNGTSGVDSVLATTNQISWDYTISSVNHVVLIPETFQASIDGDEIGIGDYIGAFYMDNGLYHCAGYTQWLGSTNEITVWGDDVQTSDKDGFNENEIIHWKIWRLFENDTYICDPVYMGSPMSHQGTFASNGLSGLESLSYVSASPGWTYTVTGTNHTILLPFNATYEVNGLPVSIGDYIGVFYDSAGTESCAGFTIWQGSTNYISAFGDDDLTQEIEGFAANETFKWKIWSLNDETAYHVDASYNASFPNSGEFTANGQSSIETLSTPIDLLPWSFQATCCNHTMLIPSSASLLFENDPLTSGFYLGVFYDSLGTLACAGYTKWENITTSITIWGDDPQTTNKEGFSDNEAFIWKVWDPNVNQEYYPLVEYIQPPVMPNTGNYATNGLSGISSLQVSVPNLPWNYVNTGNNHSVLIPESGTYSINDSQLESGDYIGAFYDSSGFLACAGYMQWFGINTAVTVWGSDIGFDGMNAGEEFKWKVWDASENMEYQVYATYDSLFPNQQYYAYNGISKITSLSTSPPFEVQSIELIQGWGIYSTYIAPFENSFDSLFHEMDSNIFIIKNNPGQVYWPDFNINDIDSLIQRDGYVIKMKQTDTLHVTGIAIIPELYEITINQGWDIIAYLRKSAAPIVQLLAPVVNDIIIVKDGNGNLYWPDYGINFIGEMKPDYGYMIKLNQANLYIYPAN